MKCCHCTSASVVKNGRSRHGHQRWLCRDCQRTCGEQDHRRIAPEKRTAALDHYLEGVGLRATERLVGVSHNSVMNWVCEEVAGKALAQVPASAVEWVEADELWTYVGKRNEARWLWWAIDRSSKRVCGWALGDRSTQTAERLDAQLPHAEHITFCTDFWRPYELIFQTQRHLQGKTHTFTIESWNNRIRIYLARLRRRTHCYSKSSKNLAASILLFLLRKCNVNT